ncbi:flavin reductase family protein [Foetidibacter luteolus]|uniref:flavin reductase family protein n=1 Tax=Foetidibacter luteolus TaxID=2608880 RepID=UPI00129A152D|nr:iron-sulfur cluster-binding domain-containing protein [Foetidibacter luteolus]
MSGDTSIYQQVAITKIIEETNDAKTFELLPMHGWQPAYSPGQFITFVFEKANGQDRRSYSFSSSPALQEAMQVTVKRVENGAYSRHMLNHLQPGDILTTSGISGYFRLPENFSGTSCLFFFAAGSGITPVFSLVKTALHTTQLPIVLVYSNRSPQDAIFYERLQQMEKEFTGRFKVRYLFSNIRDVYKSRLSNWLLLQLLQEYNVDRKHTLFYMCGPFVYMQMIMITLLTESVPPQHLHKEDFSMLPRIHKPKPPDTAPHEAEIHINNRVHILTVQYPDNILSAAKKQQIQLPYSCQAGRCGSCAATCTRGQVWMAYNEILTDDEVAAGRVLTCQGYPVNGNVVIRF